MARIIERLRSAAHIRGGTPRLQPEPSERATPPPGARNFVLLVLDSCRFDSFVAADPRHMAGLGEVQRRWSYASWTSPSHFNLLMGLLPHASPTHVFASEVYKEQYLEYERRLGVSGVGFASMVPRLWLPAYLRGSLGYETRAAVSLPVLNPATPLNADFDSYVLAERHNDLAAMVRGLRFTEERPTFWLLNAGETHYPYATADEPESEWPRVHGVHGVFKQIDERLRDGAPVATAEAPQLFDQARLDALRARQVNAVSAVDAIVEELLDTLPRNTWLTITADHGEMFGEAGYFGHGPIMHEKVFEVPFVEGLVR
jgi:hypothetical protein